MSVTAAAIIGSTVVSGVMSNKASKAQQASSKEATAAQVEMGEKNIEFQREMTEIMREDFKPWREAGGKALQQITAGIEAGTFDVGDFDVRQDPSYQFRLGEGLKALERKGAALGKLESGAYDKALNRYAQDYASTEYANAYARNMAEQDRKFNMLAGLSGAGQSSAARQSAATSQLASSAGNIMANQGSAMASGIAGAGAAAAQGYLGTAQALNQGAQNWLTYKGVKKDGS